jgi:large subunit ribosomal protein L35
MPKLKTKSSVKKRFKVSATGKLVSSRAGKNHFMSHKTNKQSRKLRGTNVMDTTISQNIKKHFLPYQ